MTYTNAEKMIKKALARGSAEHFGRLLFKLGNPEKRLNLIKIYGTSGKSSVCALLSAALSAAGYRVGRLTSPIIHSVPESICIYERPISIDFFTKISDRVYKSICELKKELDDGVQFSLGREELLFAVSLMAFSEADCDFAIIEVPTDNVTHTLLSSPLLSVISTVDSTKSARGICARLDRDSKEVVSAIQSKEVHKLIFDKCAEINTRFSMPLKNAFVFMTAAAKRIEFTYRGKFYTNGCGAYYQANNFITVLEAVEALRRLNVKIAGVDVCSAVLCDGIPLRFEIISIMPTIIIDRADTEEKCNALTESMKLIGCAATPTVVCENANEFTFTDYDVRLCEIPSNGFKKQLRGILPTLTEDDTVIIIGSSEYCENAAKLTKEILM